MPPKLTNCLLVPISPSKRYCVECSRIKHIDEFKPKDGICRICRQQMHDRKMELRNTRTLIQTAKQLAEIVEEARKGNRERLMTPELAESTIARLGGMEAVAEILGTTIDRLTGKGLSKDQLTTFHWKDGTILGYMRLLAAMIRDRDQTITQSDPSELTEDEIKESLKDLAFGLVEDDETLRKQIALDAIIKNPELVQEAAARLAVKAGELRQGAEAYSAQDSTEDALEVTDFESSDNQEDQDELL